MDKKKKERYIYRDAGSGKLVTKEYAEQNPNTTVRETVSENKKATD